MTHSGQHNTCAIDDCQCRCFECCALYRRSRGDSSKAECSPIQAGNGGSTPASPLQFHIQKVNHTIAKQWVETWHYSHRMPTGKNINYGLYANAELYAVIVYGIGVNPYQARFLGVDRVLEIKRMCRSEPRMDYSLSRFIGITSKMVLREFPYDCLVAFADPEQGHEGTVYKASGFMLHGMSNAEWHLLDKNGETRHRRYALRHAERNGISIAESRLRLGLSRIKTQPKYRWVRFHTSVTQKSRPLH